MLPRAIHNICPLSCGLQVRSCVVREAAAHGAGILDVTFTLDDLSHPHVRRARISGVAARLRWMLGETGCQCLGGGIVVAGAGQAKI